MDTLRKALKVAVVACVVLLVWPDSSESFDFGPPTRGRVTMNGKTIITDWGTLLRGGCWALDMIRNLPPRQDLVTIKQCGVNCVHVYFEKYDASYCYPGYNAERMDTLVEWCREESLYVIMTIGSSILGPWSAEKMKDVNAIKAIWEVYAPRYADQTHVIYEIKNEPGWAEVNIARACYPIMRAAAPETHILQGSYSNVAGGPSRVLAPIDSLKGVIDWSNASIAFHGYVASGEFQEAVIKTVNDAGYCMTMTECWANKGYEQHYEHAQISYCPMAGCFNPMAQRKCDQMKKLNPSYAPDFGSWPQAHVEHLPLPVETLCAPAGRPAAWGQSAVVFPFVMNRSPRGDVQAVYDLSGRLLWSSRPDSHQANSSGAAEIPKDLGSRPLLLKYAH